MGNSGLRVYNWDSGLRVYNVDLGFRALVRGIRSPGCAMGIQFIIDGD